MDIKEFKDRFSILEVCQKLGIELPEMGEGTKAIKCFAHDDDHPSLIIMPKVNSFNCPGCGVHGDQIDLVRGVKGCSFEEAIHFLDPQYNFTQTTGESYVAAHGLKPETLAKFNVRVFTDRVEFPTPNGTKIRLFAGPNKFTQTLESTIGLFKTAEAKDFVILTEGEVDAMVVSQETGYPAWTSTGGAGSFEVGWIKDFENIKTIYVAYDNDPAGEEGATKAANILGRDRCKRLRVPKQYGKNFGKDWSDFFQHQKAEDFRELLDKSIADFRGRTLPMTNLELTSFIATGFEAMDWETGGGLAIGGSYILAGLEKCGKSAFAMSLVSNWLKAGHKVGYINIELLDGEFFQRLTGIFNEYPYRRVNDEDINKFKKLFDGQLYYAGPSDLREGGSINFMNTYQVAEDFLKEGVEVLIFDNLTSFSVKTSNETQGWQSLLKAFNKIDELTKANKKNVSICVIHTIPSVSIEDSPMNVKTYLEGDTPEKVFKDSVTVIKRPQTSTVYGGGQLQLLASGVISVWRPYQKFDKDTLNSMSQILMESNRFGKNFSGEFTFFGDRLLFLEKGKEPHSTIEEDFTKGVVLEEIK